MRAGVQSEARLKVGRERGGSTAFEDVVALRRWFLQLKRSELSLCLHVPALPEGLTLKIYWVYDVLCRDLGGCNY